MPRSPITPKLLFEQPAHHPLSQRPSIPTCQPASSLRSMAPVRPREALPPAAFTAATACRMVSCRCCCCFADTPGSTACCTHAASAAATSTAATKFPWAAGRSSSLPARWSIAGARAGWMWPASWRRSRISCSGAGRLCHAATSGASPKAARQLLLICRGTEQQKPLHVCKGMHMVLWRYPLY